MDSVYDRALSEIGTEGKFQNKFDLIYNVGLSIIWSSVYLQMVLALTIIPHNCKLPEKTQNVTDSAWKLKYIPHEIVYGKTHFDKCHIFLNPDINNVTRSCNEYEYDNTWYGTTVSSEKNWVCDKEMYIPNILAYSKIMELTGSMFFGWIGDTYGRRPTYIITICFLLFGRIISLLSGQSYIIFLCGCLISSFGVWSVLQCATVISVEITSSKRRALITSIRFGSGCIGVSTMALLYWWIKEWKIFTIVTTAPISIFLLFSWTIIESPRWLFSNGKTKQCIKQLKRIAKINHKHLESITEQEILSHIPQSESKTLGPIAMFSSWRLSINTILQLTLWATGSACFTLQVLCIGQNSNGNPFLELCWQTMAEIPANFVSAWLADHLGRRYTSALASSLMAAASFLLAIRETSSYPWFKDAWIATVLNVILRFSNAVSYYVANLFAMELYPTFLRQSALSLGNVFGSLGAVITPYILFLGRPIDERLPGLVITMLALMSMWFSILLPETLNQKLPETIEEAQSFGQKNPKYTSVPQQSNQ